MIRLVTNSAAKWVSVEAWKRMSAAKQSRVALSDPHIAPDKPTLTVAHYNKQQHAQPLPTIMEEETSAHTVTAYDA